MNDPSEQAKLWLKRRQEREEETLRVTSKEQADIDRQKREAEFAAMFAFSETPTENRWERDRAARNGFAE